MNQHATNCATSTGSRERDARERMPAKVVLPTTATKSALADLLPAAAPARETADSLFEQFAWLYIFFRENLFRDDTDRISAALWPETQPTSDAQLVELGCGPGFYSSRLARRFPQLRVVGVDRSARQLTWARQRVDRLGLTNCRFQNGDVRDIPCRDEAFDFLVASRLFTVLPERERALAEMHRVLKSGGRCFVAEPRRALRASVPLFAMWLLARATHFRNGYREPRKAVTLLSDEFHQLIAQQPWRECRFWQDNRYQYALCEKA